MEFIVRFISETGHWAKLSGIVCCCANAALEVGTMEKLDRLCNEVLFYVWDPIGVATSATARDEYDSYAKTVFKYLQEDQNAKKIADYLGKVRTKSIGLPPAPKKDREVAELLVVWRKSVREGIA